jgi:two-component system, OmpR family, response regulator
MSSSKPTRPLPILLVEDDRELAATLTDSFGRHGCTMDWAADGHGGVELATRGQFEVLILDRMLPGLDGLEVLRRIRQAGVRTPVIYLTTMSGINDRVEGLEAGADDYLVKPFAFPELLARVRVLVRRDVPPRAPAIQICAGDIQMDLLQRTVLRAGRPIALMPQEFLLLEYLARNADRVVTRTMLLQNVWNIHFDPQTSVVESHISRLRAKLNEGFDRDPIQTIRNVGYRLLVSQ